MRKTTYDSVHLTQKIAPLYGKREIERVGEMKGAKDYIRLSAPHKKIRRPPYRERERERDQVR